MLNECNRMFTNYWSTDTLRSELYVHTIVSYNASAVKIYNSTACLVHFVNKKIPL
jgi:hypothetical protein